MNQAQRVMNISNSLYKSPLVKEAWPLELVRLAYVIEHLQVDKLKVTTKSVHKLINDAGFIKQKGFSQFSALTENQIEDVLPILKEAIDSNLFKELVLRVLSDLSKSRSAMHFPPTIPGSVFEQAIRGFESFLGKKILVADADGALEAILFLSQRFPKTQVFAWLRHQNLYPLFSYLLADRTNVTVEVKDLINAPTEVMRFETTFCLTPFNQKFESKQINNIVQIALPPKLNADQVIPSIFEVVTAPKATVFCLVPESFLFDVRMKVTRDNLLETGHLKGIVANPPETFFPYVRVKTNFLVLHNGGDPSSNVKIRTVSLKNPTYKSPNFEELLESTREVERDAFRHFASWSVATQVEQIESFEIKGKRAELGDVIESSFRGAPISKSSDGSGSEIRARLVDYSDLDKVFSSDEIEAISFHSSRPIERYELKSGDILITARGASVKIGLAEQVTDAIYPSANLAVIRPNKKVIEPKFLFYFLKSPAGQASCKARQTSSVMMVLSVKDLKSMQVPLPSLNKQREIAAKIEKAEQDKAESIIRINEKYEESLKDAYSSMGIEEFNFMDELKKL